jgi:hypothetical protein
VAGEQAPPVFAFEGSWPFTGTPQIHGHPMAAVTGWDVHAAPDGTPVVTLALVGQDALRLILADGAARVAIADESREALVALGWKPPAAD